MRIDRIRGGRGVKGNSRERGDMEVKKEEAEFYEEVHKVTKYRFKEGFRAGVIVGTVITALIIGIVAILI